MDASEVYELSIDAWITWNHVAGGMFRDKSEEQDQREEEHGSVELPAIFF